MKKNLEHKSYHISIVIAVVIVVVCGRLRSFAVVFAVVCGRLRSFLWSFAVVFVVVCGRYLVISNPYAIIQTHKSEEKRGPQK